MKEIILARDARLALRSQAHHLDPVVLLGANGLTNAVLHEIDRALNDHELIKVRVPSDDREELESIYAEVAEKLGAARKGCFPDRPCTVSQTGGRRFPCAGNRDWAGPLFRRFGCERHGKTDSVRLQAGSIVRRDS